MSFITMCVRVCVVRLMITLMSHHAFIMMVLVFQILWMLDQVVIDEFLVIWNNIESVNQVLL